MSNFPPLRYRQIHLDFHTSEDIPDIGAEFDAADFVKTLQDAHVDSVTVFARCHHGWGYYPSNVGPSHPNLARPDLLGEMVTACRAANIETPIYITVQWDEYLARTHPEWRVMGATNRLQVPNKDDASAGGQLTATWHSLCLSNDGLFEYVRDTALEIAERYNPPGLFFDIVTGFDCVCPKCLVKLDEMGLDAGSASDRAIKDQALAASFRDRMSDAVRAKHPAMRTFYNAGHIPKRTASHFDAYSHMEIESLPTGGWGYDHFPTSARYARAQGFDTLGQTGKFHTLWGEFGGYKSSDALTYECAQMVTLGTKCLIGDQLHPNGVMNSDTYARVAPAYARVCALEPYLDGAEQVSEVAILPNEHVVPQAGTRGTQADDGAAQMLLELHIPFDIITADADFSRYRLIVLPDEILVTGALSDKLNDYINSGGSIIASCRSGLSTEGKFALELGVAMADGEVSFDPSYFVPAQGAFGASVPMNATAMYSTAQHVTLDGGECLANVHKPYFQRSWRRFSSHQHTPDDPRAEPICPAVVVTPQTAYVSYPLFSMYKRIGQPIYKHIFLGLIDRLLDRRALQVNLPSGGRTSLTYQREHNRVILHLLYGGPQVRGVAVDDLQHGVRHIEVIEDVPNLGPLSAEITCKNKPSRIFDVLTDCDIEWDWKDGIATLNVDGMHIHRAIAIQGVGTDWKEI
ncbi:beta-galactosidase trimerization domain-containing protein [Alphaproteobacteria bacterium KMM 3653]|uniref:Beta-galactosidase trimerization domain-containing protein n=1 Tax=Harenicola maris TaxID=2841044 RepID=A0AAP2CRC7_9RHOB|nr:beta-galactosidase trimerization domain-containing protein [Harenicola maris]